MFTHFPHLFDHPETKSSSLCLGNTQRLCHIIPRSNWVMLLLLGVRKDWLFGWDVNRHRIPRRWHWRWTPWNLNLHGLCLQSSQQFHGSTTIRVPLSLLLVVLPVLRSHSQGDLGDQFLLLGLQGFHQLALNCQSSLHLLQECTVLNWLISQRLVQRRCCHALWCKTDTTIWCYVMAIQMASGFTLIQIHVFRDLTMHIRQKGEIYLQCQIISTQSPRHFRIVPSQTSAY